MKDDPNRPVCPGVDFRMPQKGAPLDVDPAQPWTPRCKGGGER